MVDPIKAWATLQMGALEGWAKSVGCVLNYWRHCLDLQGRFLREMPRRCQAEIATGPSLTDKYGRRAHDIDPERDV